jgi:hypothetical protein
MANWGQQEQRIALDPRGRLQVAQDNDPAFGANRTTRRVLFDDKDAHGWDSGTAFFRSFDIPRGL